MKARRRPSAFRPAARAAPGRTEYDSLPPAMRRDYVVGLEAASERITAELNATRLALAVMLDRVGGESMIGEHDVERVSGRTITSAQVELPAGAWVFRLVERVD